MIILHFRSELTRWIEAFSSPISSDPNVTIYTDWGKLTECLSFMIE